MLRKLHIENFALIHELSLSFDTGLTVLTGETGSGKSILLGALGLVLGDRSNTSNIRHGANKCNVEALFQSEFVSKKLPSWELEPLKSGEINIRREISSSGRSRAFINDSQVSQSTLNAIGSLLVDLHGQDETRALLDRTTRLELLDDFGGHLKIRDFYRSEYSAWRTASAELDKLKARASKPQSDVDYLRFQVLDLKDLGLSTTDWDEMKEEHATLSHATELASGLNNTHIVLSQFDFNSAIKSFETISHYNKAAKELLDRLKSSKIELDDISDETIRLSDNISFDQSRFTVIEDKMDGLSRALHKHNVSTPKELLSILDGLTNQIDEVLGLKDEIIKASSKLDLLKLNMLQAGKGLTSARTVGGKNLLELVHKELGPLKLKDVKMDWVFSNASIPDLMGVEEVEVMFSANPGSPQQALALVASGGEKSRIMLAFKAAMATKKTVPTIVLDEIDSGVSGDVASRMADTMKKMAIGQQVFSVTHLAQVAALGDNHIAVSKETNTENAKTIAVYLDGEERNEAIASILSGSAITDEARAQAKVLRSQNL